MPTVRRANGARSSSALASAGREPFGRVRQAHHRAARALDPGVVRGVRPAQVPVVRGPLGEDVRLEHSRHEDGDAQAERRDLLRKRFGPPFEGAFGGGVGADRRHAPDATLARHDDDPPAPGGPHGRQQRLGEPHRLRTGSCGTAAPRPRTACPRRIRRRRSRRCARARRAHLPRPRWPGRQL